MAEAIELSVQIQGEPVLLRTIASVQQGISDFTPVWEKVAAWFYQMEAKQFASEGHGKWKPLKLSTQRERAKKGYGGAHPILEMTGRLAASLLGAEHHVRAETPTSIKLGTSLHVGHYNLGVLHQFGTKRMPARQVIGYETQGGQPKLFAEDVTSLRRIMSEYVHSVVTKSQPK